MSNLCDNHSIFYSLSSDVVEKFIVYVNCNDLGKYNCSGVINDGEPLPVRHNKGYFYTEFATQTQVHSDINFWIDVVRAFNQKYKTNLSVVTLSEECGRGIFINTDVNALFFPYKYYLELTRDYPEVSVFERYDSIKSLKSDIESELGIDLSECGITPEAVEKYVKLMVPDIDSVFIEEYQIGL